MTCVTALSANLSVPSILQLHTNCIFVIADEAALSLVLLSRCALSKREIE